MKLQNSLVKHQQIAFQFDCSTICALPFSPEKRATVTFERGTSSATLSFFPNNKTPATVGKNSSASADREQQIFFQKFGGLIQIFSKRIRRRKRRQSSTKARRRNRFPKRPQAEYFRNRAGEFRRATSIIRARLISRFSAPMRR